MGCPDDNMFVAMVEHTLDPAMLGDLELHIDGCTHCRETVAALVKRSVAHGTPPQDASNPRVATAIGERYEIRTELGRGGMGTVYLARDITLGREVALKLHRAGSADDRLHREAVAMAKLAHPNVVTVFEVANVDDRLYVAMEYIRGGTLRGWLAVKPRGWREILALLTEVGQGLAAAHDAGLVHRDFKPENVLVGIDGRPRVSDFGLARVAREDGAVVRPLSSSGSGAASAVSAVGSAEILGSEPTLAAGSALTRSGTLLGTPAYMAPEQLAGGDVDARCDQFAFCIVAWECLYGERPFKGSSIVELALAIDRGTKTTPKSEVPDRVRKVLERGLSAAPADRYSDMAGLLAALRRAAEPRTGRGIAIATGSLVLLGAAGLALGMTVSHRREAAACSAEADRVESTFGGIARATIRTAFAATRSPMAASAFDHTESVLARYAKQLAERTNAACRTEATPQVIARRTCLRARTQELASFVAALSAADEALVVQAPGAAWGLVEAAPCDDATQTSDAFTPAQRDELARLHALMTAGKYAEGAPLAQRAVDEARAANDRNFELAAVLLLAQFKEELEGPPAVEPLFHRAEELAEQLGRDLEAAVALEHLASIAGADRQDFVAAHRYAELAHAKLERLGSGNLAERGALLLTEGQIYNDEIRNGDAERAIRSAHQLLATAYGPDHPKTATALGTLSQVLRAQYKFAEAADVAQRTLTAFEKAFGPDHPMTAGAAMNLAMPLTDIGKHAEARQLLVRADAAFARVYGEVHPLRAAIAGNLGMLGLSTRDYEAAAVAYRRAVSILERTAGPESADVASALRDLSAALAAAGHFDEAIRVSARGIAILDKLGANGLTRLPGALAEGADIQLAAGHTQAAVALAERAVAIAQTRPADAMPGELSATRFSLAKAVWEAHDVQRARTLAEQAQRDPGADTATIAAWLSEHR